MDAVVLSGIKTHNLKNLDLILPHHRLYVLSGVSGSGKSSLAFDTLYAEGQRRYVESLSAYARQFLERMEKPDVDAVSGIPPAIAIEAKNVITNARSTVGTQTEINDYLRVLFSRVGKTFCPDCRTEVRHAQPSDVVEFLLSAYPARELSVLFEIPVPQKTNIQDFLPEIERQGFSECWIDGKKIPLETLSQKKKITDPLTIVTDTLKVHEKSRQRLLDSVEMAHRLGQGQFKIAAAGKVLHFSEGFRCFSCGRNFREPTPNLFSFNSPLGACSLCQGFGRVITIDWHLVVPDENKSVYDGAIEPWTKPSASREFQQLLKFCRKKKISIHEPWRALPAKQKKWILEGDQGDDYFSVRDFFDYLSKKTYKMHVRIFLSKYRGYIPCPECRETRLKPEALAVRIENKNIHEIQGMNIETFSAFLENLRFSAAEMQRVEPVYLELRKRVRFLKEVGLGYLTSSRLSRTLSGGEVQRINLATSLGAALVDTLYVLDEPSIGLHERDNHLLIRLLRELRDLGNTVVVVEHDKTMIEAADEIIDLGPEGGAGGGQLLYQGNLEGLRRCAKSLTGQYFSGAKTLARRPLPEGNSAGAIKIFQACEHNLKNIDVEIPLNRLVVLTGVSGSGKSTLLYDVLYGQYLRFRGKPVQDLGQVKKIEGFESIHDMILVDQSPIGRTPRSNPVTYLKAFDEIRKVFARSPEAKREGWEAGHFSFNVEGGRCDVCKGDGRVKVEMHFLADIFVICEGCRGTRYKDEVLKVRVNGKNIDDVLNLTVDDALAFFASEPKVLEKLQPLKKVGLSYLRLGQSATTLSGGEAQRLKLASELVQKTGKNLLYLFDEPTTGLHYHDIHYLMEAFDELLAAGHSVLVIEHNMEIIRSADYLIDLGPEGGEFGGTLVYAGPRDGILKTAGSYTGEFLKKHLEERLWAASRRM